MSTATLRIARLEAKACLLALGPWPWTAAALFLTAVWIQEPSFFRQQGLDLAWPAASATCDLLSLIVISHVFMSSSRHDVGLGSGLAGLLLVSLSTVSVTLFGLGLDACLGRTADPVQVTAFSLRPFVLWPAVCLVALGAAQRTEGHASRMLWVLLAFAVQATLLPFDVILWQRSLHSWLAVVATFAAGSAFLTSVRRQERRGDLPCA